MIDIRRPIATLAAALLTGGLGVAVASPAAQAATLSRVAEVIHYEDPTGEECSRYFMCDQPTGRFLTAFNAGGGEDNDVTVAVEDDGLSIRDAGAPLTLAPDSGCTLRDEHAAVCPLDRGVELYLHDGDDRGRVAVDVDVLQRLDGGAGDDELHGHVLFGSVGDDVLRLVGSGGGGGEGGDGDDLLAGTPGDDSLSGGAGRDLLRGLAGEDLLDGGTGPDRLLAGPGADVLEARDGHPDVVDGGRGRDVARADPRDTVRSARRRR